MPEPITPCEMLDDVSPEELNWISHRVDAFPGLLAAEEWFDEQLSGIEAAVKADTSGGRRVRVRFRPLAELLYQVRGELAVADVATFQRTWSLCRLLGLATVIEQLKAANVEGLDDRLPRLVGRDEDEFESTRFELEVAALQLTVQRSVRFLPERQGVRTPDLEVADSIEVECKRKVELSKADLLMREQWSLLKRNVHKILRGPRAFRVEFDTVGAPERDDVDWATGVLRGMAQSAPGIGCALEAVDGGRRVRLVELNMVEDNGVRVDEPPGLRPLDSFDVGSIEMTARLEGGRIVPWSSLQLCFATEHKKDWLEGARRSLRDARGQLTGTRAGVVYLEVPAAAMERSGMELGALKPVIADTFRNSRRISAILIAFTGWNEQQRSAQTEYHLECNPSADYPLPEHFFVTEEVRQQWQRSTPRNALCPCGSGNKFKRCCQS